jgi:hypothetical protein
MILVAANVATTKTTSRSPFINSLSAASAVSLRASAQDRVGGRRVEIELVALSPSGFEPNEIVRPAAPFMLVVDNYSEQDTISLIIEQEGRRLGRDRVVARENNDWNELIDLPAGVYTLREASHPDWTCRITLK